MALSACKSRSTFKSSSCALAHLVFAIILFVNTALADGSAVAPQEVPPLLAHSSPYERLIESRARVPFPAAPAPLVKSSLTQADSPGGLIPDQSNHLDAKSDRRDSNLDTRQPDFEESPIAREIIYMRDPTSWTIRRYVVRATCRTRGNPNQPNGYAMRNSLISFLMYLNAGFSRMNRPMSGQQRTPSEGWEFRFNSVGRNTVPEQLVRQFLGIVMNDDSYMTWSAFTAQIYDNTDTLDSDNTRLPYREPGVMIGHLRVRRTVPLGIQPGLLSRMGGAANGSDAAAATLVEPSAQPPPGSDADSDSDDPPFHDADTAIGEPMETESVTVGPPPLNVQSTSTLTSINSTISTSTTPLVFPTPQPTRASSMMNPTLGGSNPFLAMVGTPFDPPPLFYSNHDEL